MAKQFYPPVPSGEVGPAEVQRWKDEAVRLGVLGYYGGGGAFKHISCAPCRAHRNAVRDAQAAEKAAGIKVPAPLARDTAESFAAGSAPAAPSPALKAVIGSFRQAETVEERYRRLVSRAKRDGIMLRLVATPDPRHFSEFTLVGDSGDLASQLDIAEAYIIGLEWRNR